MALHYIFVAFFLIAFVVAIFRYLGYHFSDQLAIILNYQFTEADRDIFKTIMDSTFAMAETSVKISIYLIGVMALWLGIMKIGERGGAVNVMARMFGPFFQKLFPDIPKNHPSYGSMIMNFSANMLGLDNAATPLGLKAMTELQEVNKTKDTASNAQIMFLVLNTSGLTIIPVSVMALRASEHAANPADIFIPILLATYCATLAGLITVSIYQGINLFNKVILAYLGAATAVIASSIWYFSNLSQEEIAIQSSFIGNFLLLSIIISFIILAVRKKINVYDAFIEGAKDGFSVAIKIIPYLVAMLVAVGVFRASGAMDYLLGLLASGVELVGINSDFIPAMPTAFMKPLSGSGARGMMMETIANYGVDSFPAKLAGVFQGSTETTFYTLAVYFGAVGVKRTRYALGAGLIADFFGILSAIFIAYLFFY